MNNKITKRDVFSSLFWKFVERSGAHGISLLVSIVLARLLLPEEYGLISLTTIFITLANVFIQSGFNTALIQKKDVDDLDFSTVFYASLLIAGLLYIILFFSSQFIANFYGEPKLIAVLRVLSIILFFGAVNSIQIAIISRNMQFKKLFYSNIGAIMVSGVIGIVMAYNGYGVWALVGQQLSNHFFSTAIMWFKVKWRPKLLFSLARLQNLLSYGSKILVANLITTLFLDLRSLIIGKMYSANMLAYFNKGKMFPSVIITNINGSIQSVMLPTYSSQQDNKRRVKAMVRRSIKTSTFIVFPMMIGLAIVAEPLVKVILTEKWQSSVPFLQIFCFTYMLMPIHTANLEAIKALGYSNSILKIEIVKKVLEFITLVISLNYGVYAIAIGTFITSIISLVINSYPNIKILNYGYREQIRDIAPSLLLSIIMGIVIYTITFIRLPTLLTLFLQVCIGIIIYLGMARLFRIESFVYLYSTISVFLSKNRKDKAGCEKK